MLLMPRSPTFLVARDAILSADMMRFGGENQDLIWRASPGAASARTRPRPGRTTRIRGLATSRRSRSEGDARVRGRREGRGRHAAGRRSRSSSATTRPARRRSTTRRTSFRDKRGYNFIARANGYGLVRFHVDGDDIRAGKTKTIRIYFPTNWASTTKGAVAAGDGVNHVRLIDDTEATNWQSTTGRGAGQAGHRRLRRAALVRRGQGERLPRRRPEPVLGSAPVRAPRVHGRAPRRRTRRAIRSSRTGGGRSCAPRRTRSPAHPRARSRPTCSSGRGTSGRPGRRT